MRIGLFTDTYLPDINGVVSSVVTLKEALEAHGHTVYVVTNHSNVFYKDFEDNVLRLPGLEIKSLYGYNLTNPLQIGAADMIEDWDLDIIHVHTEFGVGIFARSVAKILKIPLISTYHTTYEDYTHYVNIFDSETIDIIAKKLVAHLSKTYTKTSEVVIAPSQKTKEMLRGYKINNEIAVVPTGLNLDKFNPDKTSQEAISKIRKEYHISDDDTLFVYLGRVAQEKSIDLVVKAFKDIKDKDVNAKLLIVGSGPDLPVLRELVDKLDIKDYVKFAGAKLPEEVPSFYHASDAFISASLTETQGMTYIEALASGLPVFARKDEVLEEIIIDQETGFYFNDEHDLADALEHYVNSPNLKESMGAAAMTIAKKYDVEFFYESVYRCYEKTIEKAEHDNKKNKSI